MSAAGIFFIVPYLPCVSYAQSKAMATVTQIAPAMHLASVAWSPLLDGQTASSNANAAGGSLPALQTINLSATAEWFAGSQHLTGTATLQANADGSSTEQLSLGAASRTVTQGAADAEKTCGWTDASGKAHDLPGANCFVALPWFAPQLFAQVSTVLPSFLSLTDDGNVVSNGASYRQLRFVPQVQGPTDADTAWMRKAGTVRVLFDLKTVLPARLEYVIHPDGNDLQDIDVAVEFSDYRAVSGTMLPFHIEKYVNRLLQLKLDVSSATAK